MARQNPNSEFARLVRDRLEDFVDNPLEELQDFKPHLKIIIREIFKSWFFGKFTRVQEPALEKKVEETITGLDRPLSILGRVAEKRSSIDHSNLEGKEIANSTGVTRLEKIDDPDDLL